MTNRLAPHESCPTGDFSAASWERIDKVCLRFEAAWQSGDPPALETYLKGFEGRLQSALFAELLPLDIEYRIRAGEQPNRTDYETRFPSETNAIQFAFDSGAEFVLRSPIDLAEGPLPARELSLTSQFQLNRFHARGGLGVIYQARETRFGRDVAVKFARYRSPHSAAQRRLAREAEITGRLEHPGVVPVYAAGSTPHGMPCYVMQWIEGQTLQEAIEQFHAARADAPKSAFDEVAFRKLLQQFITVCNTVAFAHEQGVIHRDIKPANIMLGRFGETFLMDWGLAKSLGGDGDGNHPQATSATVAAAEASDTVTGQLVGTPAFASPEQLRGETAEHNICSDVYSLGATLYFLLVGQAPHSAAGGLATVPPRAIPGPPRPRDLNPAVPRALEAICLKALAADPTQRYASAQRLAADLELYLADQPIALVCEPWGARTQRWLRHHPRLAAGLAASLLVAFASLALGSLLLGHKNRELFAANADLRKTQESLSSAQRETMAALATLTDNFVLRWLARSGELDPDDKAFLNSILSQYQRFAETQLSRATALETKAIGFLRVGQLHQVLGNKPQAIEAWRAGLEWIDSGSGHTGDEIQSAQSRMLAALGTVLADLGDRDEARATIEKGVSVARELAGRPGNQIRYQLELANGLDRLGNVLMQRGEYPTAGERFRNALDELPELPLESPDIEGQYQHQLAATTHNLAYALMMMGEFGQAEVELTRALDRYTALQPTTSGRLPIRIDRCRVQSSLGKAQIDLGKLEQAESNFQAAIDQATSIVETYPRLSDPYRLRAMSLHGLAIIRKKTSRLADAFTQSERSIPDIDKAVAMAPDEISYRFNQFQVHLLRSELAMALGRSTDADQALAVTVEFAEELFRRDDRLTHRAALVSALVANAHHCFQQKRARKTIDLAERAIQLAVELDAIRRTYNLTFELVGAHQLCGWTLLYTRRPDQALDHFDRILELTRETPIVFHGEDMQLSASVYRANCLAQIDPSQAVCEVQAIAERSDLLPLHRFNLACAAGLASQQIEQELRPATTSLALDLLRQAADAGYFAQSSSIDQLRKNPNFAHLRERAEYRQIEQQIHGGESDTPPVDQID